MFEEQQRINENSNSSQVFKVKKDNQHFILKNFDKYEDAKVEMKLLSMWGEKIRSKEEAIEFPEIFECVDNGAESHLLMQFFEGQNFLDLIRTNSMEKEQIERIQRKMGEILKKIHLTTPNFGLKGFGCILSIDHNNFLHGEQNSFDIDGEWFDEAILSLRDFKIFKESTGIEEKIKNHLKHSKLLSSQKTILHGDFREGIFF